MSANNRIALYGGSFDPPHTGHRKLVETFWKEFPNTNKLCIVPNKVSPFKKEKYFSAEECFQLSKINFQSIQDDKIEVMDLEIQKTTPSYSYETILNIKKKYSNSELDLILGDDQLNDLSKWKEFPIILKEVSRFIIFRRITEPGETIPIPKELQNNDLVILENPIWEESSSQWRNWPNHYSIYPPVLEKMKSIVSTKYSDSIIQEWKEIVAKEITETRYEHVIRVAKIAKELATIHGYLFPEKAELAGIVHDITKQKNREFHIELFTRHEFLNYTNLPKQAYHAYSAKYLLSDMGLTDTEILKSVQSHTLGGSDMGFLESIIYASDFLGSDYVASSPHKDEWLMRTSENLSYGIFIKSKSTIQDLIDKNFNIHTNTIKSYNKSLELLSQE